MPLLKVLLVDALHACGRHADANAYLSGLHAGACQEARIGARAVRDDLRSLRDVTLVELDCACAPWRRFDRAVRAVDAVWLLVFSAGDLPDRLSQHVLLRERLLLGSRPDALQLCASRRRSAHALASAGVPVAPVYGAGQRLPPERGPWMVRPDAGDPWCDTHLFHSAASALAWCAMAAPPHPGGRSHAPYILQPFVAGKPGSMSLLCREGKAQLLGCNELRLAIRDQQFHLLGVTVNNFPDPQAECERLGQSVAAAMPGLWGHVNVDFVMAAHGPVVLDVSITPGCAYAGLQASLGCNPAALAIDLIGHPLSQHAKFTALPVSVDADAFEKRDEAP